MTKQVIRDKSGNVLFECEADTLKEAVEKAVRSGRALHGANLTCANLRRADLHRANLAGANLTCANLTCANLVGADLHRANLAGADLTGANLAGADLRGAKLTGAVLTGANLRGAFLTGANLSGVLGIIAAGTPDGFTAYGWLRDGYLSIRVGCREVRLIGALAYWTKGKENRLEVRAAVKYIAKVAKARDWPLTEAEGSK